jgi:hypothetical protein
MPIPVSKRKTEIDDEAAAQQSELELMPRLLSFSR